MPKSVILCMIGIVYFGFTRRRSARAQSISAEVWLRGIRKALPSHPLPSAAEVRWSMPPPPPPPFQPFQCVPARACVHRVARTPEAEATARSPPLAQCGRDCKHDGHEHGNYRAPERITVVAVYLRVARYYRARHKRVMLLYCTVFFLSVLLLILLFFHAFFIARETQVAFPPLFPSGPQTAELRACTRDLGHVMQRELADKIS